MPESEFCPNCGSPVRRGQPFCRRCGTDLRAETAGTRPTDPGRPAGTPAPPPPPPPGGSPAAASRTAAGPAWPAYAGAAASSVLAIAAGLPWFDNELGQADGFDVPIAALVSDSAGDGIGIGLVLVILAGIGLLVALLAPTARALPAAFLGVGGICTLLLAWYLIRVASLIPEGGSFGAAVAFGVWVALLAAITVAVSAALLAAAGGRRGPRG